MTEQTRTNLPASASASAPAPPPPGRGAGGTLVAACVGLVLGLLALGPGLGPGYLLSYDMVFVPKPQFNAAVLGISGTLPRSVPSDAVIAALARAMPADLVQKLVLLSIFVLACAGAARLLSNERAPARVAAGVLYAWNPFVAERLILGQWALLLGYAGLPWVLGAVIKPDRGPLRRASRLTVALLPAAVGGFAAMAISGLLSVPAAALARSGGRAGKAVLTSSAAPTGDPAVTNGADLTGHAAVTGSAALTGRSEVTGHATVTGSAALTGRAEVTGGVAGSATTPQVTARALLQLLRSRLTWVMLTITVLAVLSLPWLIPSLTRHVDTSTAGVAAFAARADTPFGTAGSLLLLGGSWNAQTVPAGYGGAASAIGGCLAITALGGFLLFGRRRWPGLGVAAALGLLIAMLGAVGPGRDLLRAMIAAWPGFAVLRDGQQFVAPLALAEAAGIGLVVAWILRQPWSRTGREAAAIAAVGIVVVPLLALPGLAWGAAGRLRPVEYPADWLAAQRLMNADPQAGRALLLPWGAYRRFGWNRDEALLDPWPRLLSRQVVWNDGVQVGSLQIPPEDPAAMAISGVVNSGGPLTNALRARGYRYVIVDAGVGLGGQEYRIGSRLPGCRLVLSGPGLVVYQIPG